MKLPKPFKAFVLIDPKTGGWFPYSLRPSAREATDLAYDKTRQCAVRLLCTPIMPKSLLPRPQKKRRK